MLIPVIVLTLLVLPPGYCKDETNGGPTPPVVPAAPTAKVTPATPAATAPQDENPDQFPVNEEAVADTVTSSMLAIESKADALSDELLYYAESIDTFFVQGQVDEESNKTRVQIDALSSWLDGGQFLYKTNVDARIDLPRLEKKLAFELRNQQDTTPDMPPSTSGTQHPIEALTTQDNYEAALRYIYKAERLLNISVRSGAIFAGDIIPFIEVRGRRSWVLNKWGVNFTETLGERRNDGLTADTQLDFERPIPEHNMMLRISSFGRWWDDSQHWDLGQVASLFHKIDGDNAVIYQIGATGASEGTLTQVNAYYATINYRHRLRRHWIFLELSPQVVYARDHAFQAQSAITLKLEFVFGRRDR